MKTLVFRLHPGDDLKHQIEKRISENVNTRAAFVMSCIGSIRSAVIRMAGTRQPSILEGPFDIISLSGTVAQNGSHLHIAIADNGGETKGGHLMHGCEILTTAEVILGLLPEYEFTRELDQKSGFSKLQINKVPQQ